MCLFAQFALLAGTFHFPSLGIFFPPKAVCRGMRYASGADPSSFNNIKS